MNVTDFLPKYPNINKVKNASYLNPYVENFYNAIYEKGEFYDEKLPKIEEFPREKGEFLKAQKIISRYFSTFTTYDRVLLVWAMGAGKTSAAIAAIEKIKNENSTIDKALIFAKGEGILNNFVQELVFTATKGQYIPDNYELLSEADKENVRLKTKIKDFYELNTFQKTAKDLSTKSDEYIRKEYSNKIIVIDEVHNIRMKKLRIDSKDDDLYTQFYRLCHIPNNTKILLLSGTPMKDTPDEIANVMNLLLPINENLPTGRQFYNEFLQRKGDTFLLTDDPSKINELKQSFKGRVSYLKAIESIVPKVFVGESIPGFDHFKIDVDIMSSFQSEIYEKAYEMDTNTLITNDMENDVETRKGIYDNSVQAILFVFPDGSYGPTGFNKYIQQSGKKYKMKKSLYDALKGVNDDESLRKLQKYSSKYATTIANLLDNYKNGRNGFVYNEYVMGSGLVLFSLILSTIFGFNESNGNDLTEGRRFAVLIGDKTQKNINSIIKTFNKPNNMNGKYISVLIGSRLISEGYNFKNVQSENILTPFWNYSETAQVIARGYRFGSHKDLIMDGQNPIMYVYQRASVTNNNKIPSIDIIRYQRSEQKDVLIKQFERLIKESAFDCALTYERNLITGKNGQRDCDYQICDYKCDGIDINNLILSPNEIDYNTYNLYYLNQTIESTIKRIKNIFRKNFSYDYTTIKILLDDIDDFTLLSSLNRIISNSIPIKNKYGFICYLNEQDNIYFLIESLSLNSDILSLYYTEYPTVFDSKTYNQIVTKLATYEYNTKLIDIFTENDDVSLERKLYIIDTIESLPLKVKQYILENVLLSTSLDNKTCNSFTTDTILQHYNKYIFKKDDKIYHNFNDKSRCLTDSGWIDCVFDISSFEKKIEKPSVSQEYGFVGVYDQNKFKIKSIKQNVTDSRKASRGQVCSTSDRLILAWIMVTLTNQPYNESKLDYENITEDEIENIFKVKNNIKKLVDFASNQQIKEVDVTDEMINELYDSLTEQQKRYIISWLGAKNKSVICNFIEEAFKQYNIIET